MSTTQSTQESQGLDTAQSTPDLKGLGTLCSIGEKFLTPEHEAHIAGRGLLNPWARECSFSASIAQASLYGISTKSAGILFIGQNGQVQFRPDVREPKRGKKEPPKYLTSVGEFDAFVPPSPDNPLYWEIEALKREAFYINDVPYILLTEGVFKALAGCSNGIPTISLLGVEQGLTGKARDPENQRFLVPALRKLAEAGFGFIIAFDADAATNPNVRAAEKKLAKQLAKFKVPVRSITGCWEAGPKGEFKGMDDFIQNKGIEEFRAILTKAKLFDEKESDAKGEKKSKIPSSDAMARQIAEDYRDKLAFNNEVLCWYRYEADAPGIWSPETDEFIESIVYKIIESKGIINIPPSYIGATVRFLRCKLIERKWQPKTGLLPFQNGALEIATSKLHPHSPGYKFTWALPRPHSIVATDWGNISQWLDTATGGNLHIKNLLLAYAAATLKGRADIQKFLHLIGIGGSGKGTFCRLLISLIGIENTHSSTLDDWCSNRFEAAQAYGKRLLIFPDEDKGTRSLGKFKQLTGGDWLRAEEKGKKPFKFKFEGMVVVASNFPIFGADNSSGMSRRTIAVPFNAAVGRNARRNLDNDFEPELPAFTNYLLSLDDAWVANTLRGVMDIPEIGAQFWESKIREDSIAGFLNDKLIFDPLGQVSVGDSPSAEGTLYQVYHQYCSDQGHKPQAVKNFSPNLIECASTILGWQIEKAHTKIGKIIKGLRLRTKADEHLPTYDYELQLRCKAGDGFGDGSVTDSVTGRNTYPEPITAMVTDSSYTQVEKNIDNTTTEIKEAPKGISEDEITNAGDDIGLNPSPSPEPLPVVNPDPSPHPSPHPSPIVPPEPQPEPTPIAPPESIIKHHKEFTEGDRVVITEVGNIHHGQRGEVVYVGYGSRETDYKIKLDKISHNLQVITVAVPKISHAPVLMQLKAEGEAPC
ncbi:MULTISPECIES: phage/plasmid primase, P4 family [unclassified Tychonema]|uniref:phage/plasmid primase, P4 family n=1 Tax=unclassified Tychonema TaxID=2642144 RepID=UPI001D157291|nr:MULTISPECIES: phage/plasmid primase, P4 family [unclassified Tychonema]